MRTDATIHLSFTKPNKRQKHLQGETVIKHGDIYVWIRSKQPVEELIDTFYHEMTHMFFDLFPVKVRPAQETLMARLAGYSAKAFIQAWNDSKTKNLACFTEKEERQWRKKWRNKSTPLTLK